MKSWGYGPRSSGGLQSVGALKQYGLLTDSGSGSQRQVSLTREAQELLVYGADKGSQEWKVRAREAALRPKVHKALWEKYDGSLPEDFVMLPFLKLELGFGDEAANELLQRFRATLAYAGVSDEADTLSEPTGDSDLIDNENGAGSPEPQASPMPTPQPQAPSPPPVASPPSEGSQRSVQITYSPSAWATIHAPFPLSESDWDAMMRVLDGMKPGLVQPDE